MKTRLGPAGEDVGALGLVVGRSALVADGADRDGLDQGIASQEVEHLPDGAGGPEGVTGEGLALLALGALGNLGSGIEGEELDVAELTVRQVAENSIRQESSGRVRGGTSAVRHDLAGGSDSDLVGLC